MLLQRLREYAELQDDLGPPLYTETAVRYEIPLDSRGRAVGRSLIPLTGGQSQGDDRGILMIAPFVVDRTSGIKPCLLVDTAEYALGVTRKGRSPERVAQQHEAFVNLVHECAEETNSDTVRAVVDYLTLPPDEQIKLPEDLDSSLKVRFSVSGTHPSDLPEVQRYWRWRAIWEPGEERAYAECVVCGRHRDVVPTLPLKIKGVPRNNPTDGDVKLFSVNESAFGSYGLSYVSCAPICVECADAACKALNHLIANDINHIRVGPLVYAFWTRSSGNIVGSLLSAPTPTDVQALFRAAERGRKGALGIEGGQFNCVGLGRSTGRAAVRDWIDTSIDRVEGNLIRYFKLMTITEPWGSDEARYFGIWRLSRGTLRSNAKETDQPDPNVPRVLMRCALSGGPLPDWLLAQVIKRLRAEQEIDHMRAALTKMVLASQREEWITTMAQLDEQNRDPAYLCGRLLAVLDQIQRAALGQRNATIIDRYFGTASSAPLTVFPRLVRGAQPHLARLRRDRTTTGRALENRMQEIIDMLDGFPTTLTLRDQGLFVLGYYHQRAADRRAAIDRREQQTTSNDEEPEG